MPFQPEHATVPSAAENAKTKGNRVAREKPNNRVDYSKRDGAANVDPAVIVTPPLAKE